MKWFFQRMAVGFLTLAGVSTLYGQGVSATGQARVADRGSVNAQGTGSVSGGKVDARLGAQGSLNSNNRAGGYYPEESEPWFANNNLRNELKLDDNQVERLRDIYNRTRSELQGRDSADQLSDEARGERMRELRNQFDDQFSQRSADVFQNENQRNRFHQLGMQYRGYSAFDNPRLQRKLNLNETQLRQLRDLNNSWNTELETLRGTYAGDRTGTEQRFNQLRDRTRTNFEGILNDQQRTAYDEMIGNRYNFGADAFLGMNNRPIGTGNQGSLLGTPRNPGGQGSGIGTPQDNGPQGSGIGTPQDNGPQGSGIGTPAGPNDSVGGASGAGAGTGGGGSGAGAGNGASGS